MQPDLRPLRHCSIMGRLKAINGARADGLQVVQESAEMG